ncbi:MAG: hypothetical protein ACI9JN_000717 [Bacteroidia bacterium]|jgi:hypothetical protein
MALRDFHDLIWDSRAKALDLLTYASEYKRTQGFLDFVDRTLPALWFTSLSVKS